MAGMAGMAGTAGVESTEIGELTLRAWRGGTDEWQGRVLRTAAERLAADGWAVAPDGTATVVLHGREFALVPGGEAQLGFDAAAFEATPEQAASYAESCRGFGFPADLRTHLAAVLSPVRTVRLPALLVGVEAVDAGEVDFEEHGWRLPTPDEWEYACGAGAPTLFRWGATHPDTDDPFSAPDGPQHRPNAFGLHIARDPYRPEVTADPGVMCGGDGGSATCGGYGSFLAWLPLATAYRDPELAELLDDGGWCDDLFGRPVVAL
ncbi:hypothetical protein [Kitasatospora arboriphila]|uniref:Sulfatase-modifying factor enzyme domain-containing protein n=1 Tax=Kitasatospora arboriphila TaxID=258052 RepID=A0ABP4DST9_9ACTN